MPLSRALSGPAYQYPAPDDSIPERPTYPDPGFSKPADIRPGEEEAGPMYVSEDAKRWIQANVTDKGYTIDWGTREIFDPYSGEVKGTVPAHFDRMI